MGTSPGRKKNGEGGVSVEYGTVNALHAIAERIGLIDIVNQAAQKRNGLPVGELAFIMAANRLLDPRPKYTIAEWYQRTYMPEILGIDLPPDSAYQTLTRCLDYLSTADRIPQIRRLNLPTSGGHSSPHLFILV